METAAVQETTTEEGEEEQELEVEQRTKEMGQCLELRKKKREPRRKGGVGTTAGAEKRRRRTERRHRPTSARWTRRFRERSSQNASRCSWKRSRVWWRWRPGRCSFSPRAGFTRFPRLPPRTVTWPSTTGSTRQTQLEPLTTTAATTMMTAFPTPASRTSRTFGTGTGSRVRGMG
ncbi:unnamed protein product, partial [Laminaria digitata]